MGKRIAAATALAALMAAPVLAATDFSGAAEVFAEFQALCESEGGALWGVSLCGPVLLVDPLSRAVAANVPDSGGALRRDGDVFLGRLPSEVPVANTGVDWSGTRWSMLLWPLPEERPARLVLLAHEAFHRIQPKLGLEPREGDNGHLDSFEGRYWMRLEMRALDRALSTSGEARRTAVSDALLFRAKRHALIPSAAANESALESNEGLAEYTGVAAGAPAAGEEPRAWARRALVAVEKRPSLVRSFAYGTGPAYGLLLDEAAIPWRERALRGASFGDLARDAFGLEDDDSGAAAKGRAGQYGGGDIAAEERRRDEERAARTARFRARLLDGPVVIVPLDGARSTFDPNRIFPLDGEGTVYAVYGASGPWGEISSREMALVAPDWSLLRVAGPPRFQEDEISGEGWSLKLNPGWELAPAERAGDLIVVEQPAQK